MEEAQKPFICTVEGCSMRFTHEDNLSVHKKKHDMVLNLGNQKTNVFVADQTPTPTRFIRNCEEVGLFQDLQNVNPFEETFRKAVELTRVGGCHLEVPSLHVSAATDDTLHTPHVFPNITEEHSSITNLITAVSVPETPSGDKSEGREGLEPLQVPTILHSESTVIEITDTTNLETGIEITGLDSTEILVKQEADASQHIPSRASSVDSGCKIPVTSASARDTVQVVFRMPDGRLVQLSGVSMDSIPSTQLPVQQVPPPVVQTAPITQSSSSPNAVIINTQFVQTAARMAQVSSGVQQSIVALPASPVPISTSTIIETVNTPQARLSAAKMKLKQRIQSNSRRKQTSSEVESSQTYQKKAIGQRTVRAPSSEGSDTSISFSPRGKRMSNSTSDADEQKMRFRERNRAAAMRCREKRKHWIHELEKRADDTQRINHQLTAEVTKLRSELVQLKTLLLAHKDCSVTKAMQQGMGITIARPANTIKSCQLSEIQLQQPTVTIPQVPETITGDLHFCDSPEDPHPKVVLLSKPAGLKRRRQAALAALAVVENGMVHSKDLQVEQSNTTHVTVSQPMCVTPTASNTQQMSNDNNPEDNSNIITDSVTTSPPTCVITVTAPTLISTGVSGQSIAIKPSALTSTSYLMPAKLCLPADSTLPQIIKLNTNIHKSETMKTNNVAHSNGDSMDSGHGSDIEILAEIYIKPEDKS